MPVSAVPCCGCAVVLLVSTSPCFCVLCANYFALLGLMWARARKSSPRKPKMGKICCFQARRASIFAETPLEGSRRASFSRTSSRGIPPGEFVVPCAWQPGPSTGTLNLLMHSCSHLMEAGRRRPRSTRWVNVRIGGPRHPLAGPRPPPIGLACELKGSRARDAFIETEVGLGWLVAYVDRLFARG